jgi:acetyl-CoA C-acetyltransferase
VTLRSQFGTDVLITGWAHSNFGKLDDGVESLVVAVAAEAVATAGLEFKDIDAVFVGNFNSGMVPLAFVSSLVLQASNALLGVSATRVENACASGSAAVHQGMQALLAGTARNVLVIGVELMSHASAAVVGGALLGADYEMAGQDSTTGFAGIFANVADAYSDRYGDCADALAMIAAKSHHNAMDNPYAHLRKDLGYEFCRTVSEKNPIVAGRLRRTDCSPVSDGAAALVLSSDARPSRQPAVRLIGFGHANDFLPSEKRDPLAFVGTEMAWNRALGMAEVGLSDLSLIELHDCFTIAELNLYEVLGIAARGRGREAIEEGWVLPTGRTPVNRSGGLKSKGHPVGATGVSQHVLAAQQLTGMAGDMQLPDVTRVAVHNMGGLAVANYVGVLESA